MPLLSCNNLDKSYKIGFSQRKKKHVLKDVSFSVNKGEVFGVIGPNGAGKSTLLKIIMRFVLPDKGTAIFSNTDPETTLRYKNIGYLPENPTLYSHLTPREHLLFACKIEKINGKEAQQRIESTLETVDLSAEIDTPVGRFSKGMTQRAGLAYALILNPEFLILDEPMSGLDPLGRQLVVDIIKKYHSKGTTILFCSHILSDVERICDRIGIMKNGELISIATPSELLNSNSQLVTDNSKTPLENYFLNIIRGTDC